MLLEAIQKAVKQTHIVLWKEEVEESPIRLKVRSKTKEDILFNVNQGCSILEKWSNSKTKIGEHFIRIDIPLKESIIHASIYGNGTVQLQGEGRGKWLASHIDEIVTKLEKKKLKVNNKPKQTRTQLEKDSDADVEPAKKTTPSKKDGNELSTAVCEAGIQRPNPNMTEDTLSDTPNKVHKERSKSIKSLTNSTKDKSEAESQNQAIVRHQTNKAILHADEDGSETEIDNKNEEKYRKNSEIKNNSSKPKRNQYIEFKMIDIKQWKKGQVMYKQPKVRGRHKNYVNIAELNKKPSAINWMEVENWREINMDVKRPEEIKQESAEETNPDQPMPLSGKRNDEDQSVLPGGKTSINSTSQLKFEEFYFTNFEVYNRVHTKQQLKLNSTYQQTVLTSTKPVNRSTDQLTEESKREDKVKSTEAIYEVELEFRNTSAQTLKPTSEVNPPHSDGENIVSISKIKPPILTEKGNLQQTAEVEEVYSTERKSPKLTELTAMENYLQSVEEMDNLLLDLKTEQEKETLSKSLLNSTSIQKDDEKQFLSNSSTEMPVHKSPKKTEEENANVIKMPMSSKVTADENSLQTDYEEKHEFSSKSPTKTSVHTNHNENYRKEIVDEN